LAADPQKVISLHGFGIKLQVKSLKLSKLFVEISESFMGFFAFGLGTFSQYVFFKSSV